MQAGPPSIHASSVAHVFTHSAWHSLYLSRRLLSFTSFVFIVSVGLDPASLTHTVVDVHVPGWFLFLQSTFVTHFADTAVLMAHTSNTHNSPAMMLFFIASPPPAGKRSQAEELLQCLLYKKVQQRHNYISGRRIHTQMDLTPLGLSKGESEVYLALLNNGPSTVSAIAKTITISRPHVYDILDKLANKGLVSHARKDATIHYSATMPSNLRDFLKEKEDFLDTMLPSLDALYHSTRHSHSVEILEGLCGLKYVFNDILRTRPAELLVEGGAGLAVTLLPSFLEIWHKKRIRAAIQMKVIMGFDAAAQQRGESLSKMRRTDVRYDTEKYPSPSTIYLYNDQVVFMIWHEEHPRAILLRDASLHKLFKSHFDTLWDHATSHALRLESRHRVNLYELMNQAHTSIDILGIVCVEPLHEGRSKILDLLRKGRKVRVLMADTTSDYFKNRVALEERYITTIDDSRLLHESKSALANLKDINARLRGTCDLEVRTYSVPANKMMLILDAKTVLYNKYPTKKGSYGSSAPVRIFDISADPQTFATAVNEFEEIWNDSTPVPL